MPNDREYQGMLMRRAKSGRSQFAEETEKKLEQLLRLHITNEKNTDDLRHKVTSNPKFNIYSAFQDID